MPNIRPICHCVAPFLAACKRERKVLKKVKLSLIESVRPEYYWVKRILKIEKTQFKRLFMNERILSAV